VDYFLLIGSAIAPRPRSHRNRRFHASAGISRRRGRGLSIDRTGARTLGSDPRQVCHLRAYPARSSTNQPRRLILTPSSSKPRGLLANLRTLPSYFIPSSLILPTTLHAVIPSLINLGTPYLLKAKLHLDPLLNPTSYNFLTFLSSSVELAVRLPLETVLRRAQIAVAKPERTIVPVGRYAGPIGTAWVIMKEEERGKWGIEGLYRGWRIGAWSNAGVLGLGLLGVQSGTTHEF
jgi:hypothetical protein